MAKKILSACLVLCMLFSLSAMAYELPQSTNPVTVTKSGDTYTVTVSASEFKNSDISLMAVDNSSEVPSFVTDASVGYFGVETADENGDATFIFQLKDGFTASFGVYMVVSNERGITYKGSEEVTMEEPYKVVGTTPFDDADGIKPSDFSEKYGASFDAEAQNAQYAAVIFARLNTLKATEFGIVYSDTNPTPTIGGEDCAYKQSTGKLGDHGAFGMYFYTNNDKTDTPYYACTYVKYNGSYSYGNVVEFKVNAVAE